MAKVELCVIQNEVTSSRTTVSSRRDDVTDTPRLRPAPHCGTSRARTREVEVGEGAAGKREKDAEEEEAGKREKDAEEEEAGKREKDAEEEEKTRAQGVSGQKGALAHVPAPLLEPASCPSVESAEGASGVRRRSSSSPSRYSGG
ncbi:unnamed protein product [Lampetra fluviatilis]